MAKFNRSKDEFEIESGILPVSLFCEADNESSWLKSPTEDGMRLDNLLCPMEMEVREDMKPIVDGIEPLSKLLLRSNDCKNDKSPIVDGIECIIPQFENDSIESVVNKPMDDGIVGCIVDPTEILIPVTPFMEQLTPCHKQTESTGLSLTQVHPK